MNEVIHESIYLFVQEGSSDKFYEPKIIERPDGLFDLVADRGRRNVNRIREEKKLGVSLKEATAAYNALVKQKLRKYQIDESQSATPNHVPSVPKATQSGIPIQLLTPLDDEELDSWLDDPDVVLLEKMDGVRAAAFKGADGSIGACNRRGETTPVSAPLAAALSLLPCDTILDGELIDSTLHVFDILRYAGEDLTGYGFLFRLNAGSDDLAVRTEGNEHLRLVPWTVSDKRAAFEQLRSANAEGAVLRKARAIHAGGRPASGGNARKYKFVESATVIVDRKNDAKRSVSTYVYDEHHNSVVVGNVTIPPNHDVPSPGTLIEVRYLYAMPNGGSLVQPVYLGPRNDLDESDATLNQLKLKREPAHA